MTTGMRWPHHLLICSLVGTFACSGDDEPARTKKPKQTEQPTTTTVPTVTVQEPTDIIAHTVRASVALRGIRPSAEELSRVETDPRAFDVLVDDWVNSDAFGETIKDMHAELLLVRSDVIEPLPAIGLLEGETMHAMSTSLAESPLELVRQVVMSDRPYTDVLTTGTVRADGVVAKVYGLPYDTEAGGWQDTQWVDGRPDAGLLADSELWRRHESPGSNHNRARANFIADRFLCADFATRDITVEGGITLSDEFEVAEAVMTDPLCISCHQALDPLASAFFGFKKQTKRSTVAKAYVNKCDPDHGDDPLVPYAYAEYCYPVALYNPEDEDAWEYWALRPPGYYGSPVNDLHDIGQHIAADPRFGLCTARRFHGYFTQTDPHDLPLEEAVALRDAFDESDASAKALAAAVVRSDSFANLQRRVLRPEQMARQVEAVTGFVWWANPDLPGCDAPTTKGPNCWTEANLMANDLFGFRAMSGGVNGFQITVPTYTFTPPRELVMERFVSEAAGFVVANDFSGATPRLFTIAIEDTDPGVVKQQIADLFLPTMSRRIDADDPEVNSLYELWSDKLARSNDPRDAWAFVLTALFLDPLAVTF